MNISIRNISAADLDDVAKLANDRRIAGMTANLPHPYTREHAETWFAHAQNNPGEHVFAVLGDGVFMGVVGLMYEKEHARAELGYWLGQAYWNKGVMSAAAKLAVAYAFFELGVRKVYSRCFGVNTASRRVLEKNGFACEGCLRAHHIRLGAVQDVFCFGLLRDEYDTEA